MIVVGWGLGDEVDVDDEGGDVEDGDDDELMWRLMR